MQVPELTASQLRAARSVLGWSVALLSKKAGVGTATIKRYEVAEGVPNSRKGHLETLRACYEAAGIEFIGAPDDAPGIRIHSSPINR